MVLNLDLEETTADQGKLGHSWRRVCRGCGHGGERLTDGGVSVRHQDDHGHGAGVDEALVGGLQQHLHRLHQRLVDVGSYGRKKEFKSETRQNCPRRLPEAYHSL